MNVEEHHTSKQLLNMYKTESDAGLARRIQAVYLASNRRANLRIATTSQNIRHRRKFKMPSKSCYRGLTWSKELQLWRVRIWANGKRLSLGFFENEIDAAKAYEAARKYHGPFADLNFPS